jgi:hypothetical protein
MFSKFVAFFNVKLNIPARLILVTKTVNLYNMRMYERIKRKSLITNVTQNYITARIIL